MHTFHKRHIKHGSIYTVNLHTNLQHGEPSTCAYTPLVCKRLDVSAALPHMGQNLSEQPGRGQFYLQCPAHPDSLMSQTADKVPHSDHNTPVEAQAIMTVEARGR